MLMLSPKQQLEQHVQAREGLTSIFNDMLEKILNENSHRDKYWILGKTKVQKTRGKDIVRPFLQACAEKPGIIKESFVYEVDNKRGTKTLLWVMHPGDMLSFPTLGKSIRVTGGNTGSTILLPR